jgi:uncharacterized protein (DUF302 family)
MPSLLKKRVINASFDTLLGQLKDALDKEGFIVYGVTDLHKGFADRLNIHFRKYVILTVAHLHLYYQMLSISAVEGMVVPCSVTLVERYPGVVEIIPVNFTALIAKESGDSLHNLAEEVSHRLDLVIHSMEREAIHIPDLVTSWD